MTRIWLLCGFFILGCIAYSTDIPNAKPYKIEIPLGLIDPDVPKSNPLTVEKVALGGKLFFDKRLSFGGRISCATCHDPARAFTENRDVSLDAKGRSRRRNAQSVLNSAYQSLLDWDGHAATLEAQLDSVFSVWGDMAIDIGDAIMIVDSDPEYIRMFESAFGSRPTSKGFRAALASYQRSLISGSTRFDAYLFGSKETALSQEERAGWELFIGKASCITCHDVFHPSTNALGGGLALFTDHRFHNLGVGYKDGRMEDTGRFEVTRDPADFGSFKTPSIRNVAVTSPYMHDGSLKTLEEVVDFYNRGGNPNQNLSPGIRPLLLNQAEKQSLVAFLKTLTDERWLQR
jgi:cytochrome c peroxidase